MCVVFKFKPLHHRLQVDRLLNIGVVVGNLEIRLEKYVSPPSFRNQNPKSITLSPKA